ncbi:Thioredoxin-like protein CXXS1 [Apostasia shenzhenica]|uniref:Thioredoxin-like protein CXXS1 n=1 Tax=Apostasia shenzhenica TaxID=1088818 RepID=A0A2I0B7C4_9ASPA|nr:Thioredoxin-like protein CXXS1 [Apostasia shenzhenica]
MEGQSLKSRVLKVESEESWESFMAQARSQNSPVFVHFGASWCIPSLAMNSYVEELAMTHQDLLFLFVDVDEVKRVASKMDVKAMPTFVIMKDGAVLNKMVGANSEEIRKRVEALTNSQVT